MTVHTKSISVNRTIISLEGHVTLTVPLKSRKTRGVSVRLKLKLVKKYSIEKKKNFTGRQENNHFFTGSNFPEAILRGSIFRNVFLKQIKITLFGNLKNSHLTMIFREEDVSFRVLSLFCMYTVHSITWCIAA